MEEQADQEVMDDFLSSVTYVGNVRPWRDVSETDTSEDEPDGVERMLARKEAAIHAVADAHVAKISVALRYAFAMGRRVLRDELLKLRETK